MIQFDSQVSQKPLLIVKRQYMQMVMDMLQFIGSVRAGDWNLHPLSTKTFVKYYIAYSKLNYARMIPVYLADMEALKQFCAVGADHVLEHINRSIKVSGGLVGISARTKFFLISQSLRD